MTLILSLLLSVFATNPAVGNLSESAPPTFPQYNASLDLNFDGACSCQSVFVACSQNCEGSNCTCTCSVFMCSCTKCEQLNPQTTSVAPKNNTPVSVPKEQYANWTELDNLLGKSESNLANAAKTELVTMVNYLTEQDYAAYRTSAENFLTLLGQLPAADRNIINTFFKSHGSNYRV